MISLLGVAAASAAEVPEGVLYQIFGSSSTEASRTHDWEPLAGHQTSVIGTVTGVETPGLLNPYYIVTMDGRTEDLQFLCLLPQDKAMADIAQRLRKGDRFTCQGILENYAYIWGTAAIYIHYGK